MPADVPRTWGTVARNPNWSPDAHSRTLFGPGVTELANEKPMRPMNRSTPARYGRRWRAVLYDPALADVANVAAEVGFYDQAHLTRRFKRFLGVPPGAFARRPAGL